MGSKNKHRELWLLFHLNHFIILLQESDDPGEKNNNVSISKLDENTAKHHFSVSSTDLPLTTSLLTY